MTKIPELGNDDHTWTQVELDTMLDLWCAGRAMGTIAAAIGRSVTRNGINTKLWKLACNYDDYRPMNREGRGGKPWRRNELGLVARAAAYQQKHRGVGPRGRPLGPHTLAPVLCRQTREIEQVWPGWRDPAEGFGL